MSTFEIGTDIGGSIRIPAGYCGICGHKPSFGLVPQRGYLDRVGGGTIDTDVNVFGPLARSVTDLAFLLPVMAGAVPEDSLAWRVSIPPPRHKQQSEYRVGIWTDDPECPVDGQVREVVDRELSALEARWSRIDRVAPPVSLGVSWEIHDSLVRAAVSPSLPAHLGDAVGGTHRNWLATQELRAQIRSRWAERFLRYDAFICPVMPVLPFEHDHQGDMGTRSVDVNGEQRSHVSLLRWNSMASVANLPATAVVIGWSTAGLPIAVQVIGPYLEDRTSLHIASAIEEATGGFNPPPAVRGA